MNKVILLLLAVSVFAVGYGQTKADTVKFVSKTDSGSPSKHGGWISVRSSPEGAEVYDGSLFLGVTPVDSVPAGEGPHVLRLFYPSALFWNSVLSVDTIAVITSQEKNCLVEFGVSAGPRVPRHEGESHNRNPNLFIASSHIEDTNVWEAYASGATMILAGALSAYLKTSSDNYFDTYAANRDPNLLSKVQRLDRWAGVSLFISEISFGVLTYLLLSE